MSNFAVDFNLAMMILHGVLHDGQTKAGTARLLGMALIHTIEALKHLVLMFGSDADAGIADADLYSALLLRNRNLYLYFPIFRQSALRLKDCFQSRNNSRSHFCRS